MTARISPLTPGDPVDSPDLIRPTDVTIRNFAVGDGRAIAEAWTLAAPADGITERRFRELILLDRNFDRSGLFVAELNGRVVGSAYGVRRRIAHTGDDLQAETGWLPYFFVAPEARRHGIGRKLVLAVLEWLRARGVREVFFSSYTPNYVLPGLDADRYPEALQLLLDLGFEVLERPSAMDRSLLGYRMPDDVRESVDRLRADGWYLGSPSADELAPLIEMAGEVFNSDWARAIREGVLSSVPLERIVIARNPGGELLGWAMHGTYEGVIERFGPFGVLPESRGTGLGKALLHVTLERMCALGAHSAWFLWADEGSAASHLYAKTGFQASRTFSILRAELG